MMTRRYLPPGHEAPIVHDSDSFYNRLHPKQPTVRQIVAAYLRVGARDLLPRYRDECRRVLGMFVKEFGHFAYSECKPAQLLEWVQRHPEWASDWTRSGIVSVVKRPFSWAVRMREIAFNPFTGASLRRGDPGRPMTDEEFATLLRVSKPAFRRVLIFIRATGCRPGELASLRWVDVKLEQGAILIPKHKTSGRTRRPRIIPLTRLLTKLLVWMQRHHERLHPTAERLRRLLANGPVSAPVAIRQLREEGVTYRMMHVARRAADVEVLPGKPGKPRTWALRDSEEQTDGRNALSNPHVFLNAKGYPWTRYALAMKLKRLRTKGRIPAGCKLYGLRHRFATNAVLQGVDIATLGQLMGHTDLRSTSHYLHIAGNIPHLRAAAEKVQGGNPGKPAPGPGADHLGGSS